MRKEYNEELHRQSDEFLNSDEALFHVRNAYRHVLAKHGIEDSATIYLRPPDFTLDTKWAIDGEFAVQGRDEVRLTGRVGFRSRDPNALAYGDVTISYDFEGESTLSEYDKTRANTGIYGIRLDKRDAQKGFAFFVVFHVHQVIHLIETGKIRLSIGRKGDRYRQRFASVRVRDLYVNNCLIYAGVGPLQRSDEARMSVLERALHDCSDVLSAIQADGYWSAYDKPESDPFDF